MSTLAMNGSPLGQRQTRSVKPLDVGELTVQVSGLVADTVMARLAEMGLTPDLVKMVMASAKKQPEGNSGTPWNPRPLVMQNHSHRQALQGREDEMSSARN
jgi:hypothetical protein